MRAALADVLSVPLVGRFEDDTPVHVQLPDLIDVEEDDSIDGFDTRVTFADEIHTFCDPATDGLEVVLGEQPGIDDVFAEDREVVYLATRLALPDVHAAVIRAVVDVNVHPRDPAPTGTLPDAVIDTVADQVAADLTAAGFVRGGAGHQRYFNRVVADGLVHVLMVQAASGMLGDGTVLEGRVWLFTGVVLPGVYPAPAHPVPFFFPGMCVIEQQSHPTLEDAPAAAVAAAAALGPLSSKPACAAWYAADPSRISPPMLAPKLARAFVDWAERDAAAAVLRHLERTSKWLAGTPEANEARALLRN